MLSKIGDRWRTLREWVTLGEWMPRILRLPPPPQEGFRPGLFIVEISGCDKAAWETARARGALPFLDSLVARQNYRVVDYHAGCPWSRVAREAELFHGLPGALAGELVLPLGGEAPQDLARRADALAADAVLGRRHEGLLLHGAAWGTLLPGGAAPAEFHGPLGDRAEGWVERLRNRYGAALDLRRGVPVVYLHRDCTPPADLSGDALADWWRGQDRKLARLYHRAGMSRRRDYETWLLLGPSSTRGDAFPADYARLLQATIGDAWQVTADPAARPGPARIPPGPRLLRVLARDAVAHLYADGKIDDATRREVALRILKAGAGVAAVVWRDSAGTARWQRPFGDETGLTTQPPEHQLRAWLPYLVERDAESLLDQPDAGCWLALRASPVSPPRHGVALLPRRARVGAGRGDWLRPSQLYAAARHALGRERLTHAPGAPSPAASTEPGADTDSFRFATYNVHRCIGMDGRQSVRRVLRVLGEVDPDIVALQEVSAIGANQAEQIAAELGMQVVFCPTLHGDEAYGHALLSRHPFTVNAVGLLPLTRPAPYKEPRGAIWVQVQLGLRSLHVFSTHLALGRADRSLQVDTLLGPHWIGGLPPDTPLILCGDFNFAPPGKNYRRVAARLRDVQLAHPRGVVVKTFSTVCAVTRLDHIFLSPHFVVKDVNSPRTHLTSVASDHYPLVADLHWPRT